MPADPATLVILIAVIATTMGFLLVFAWLQNRTHKALAMWGATDLVAGLGAAILAVPAPRLMPTSLDIAIGLVVAGYSISWSAARTFAARALKPWLMAAGPALWLIACSVPHFSRSVEARCLLIALLTAAYASATAYELWRDRGEPLLSRYPLVGCLAVHALCLCLRAMAALVFTLPPLGEVMHSRWAVVFGIEPVIFVIICGFLQLSMAKERSELVQRHAAETDELTGVTSRRAFLAEAERRLEASLRQSFPAALLLFDLDHFKEINDSFGHQTGDRVLRAFAERAVEALRPGDLFGRVGGEEFAALLVNTGAASAVDIAERFRELVERLELKERGEVLRLSVSVGVATTAGSSCLLGDLLRQADHALYGAKSAGRNCVRQHRLRSAPLLRAV